VLVTVLATLRPGQHVPIKILRSKGRRMTLTVTLGELRGG
jgi:S1-C subfamily serine protease